eukprot:g13699.t1
MVAETLTEVVMLGMGEVVAESLTEALTEGSLLGLGEALEDCIGEVEDVSELEDVSEVAGVGLLLLTEIGDTEGLEILLTLTDTLTDTGDRLAEDVQLLLTEGDAEILLVTLGDAEILLVTLANTGDRLVDGVCLTEAVGLGVQSTFLAP